MIVYLNGVKDRKMPMDLFFMIRNGLMEQYQQAMLNTDINSGNEYGQNLLQEAIGYCREDIAIDLINKGIDINHQDKKGWTPLHFCAQYSNTTIAEVLLQKGAKVNIVDIYGNNPLWYAVFNAHDDYKIIKLFMEYGADATTKNNAMRSPLDFARQIGDEVMIEILLRRKN